MDANQTVITMKVNGISRTLLVNNNQTLLNVLRGETGTTGVKEGCGKGECGACTVIMDGDSILSCMTLAVEADEKEIVTIEGLEQNGELHPLQVSFAEKGAVQCGFCTPGMILTAKALLDKNPHPTREEIRHGINGNICRCTGYVKIVDAIEAVANNEHNGRNER